jgi:hypothetical protein
MKEGKTIIKCKKGAKWGKLENDKKIRRLLHQEMDFKI